MSDLSNEGKTLEEIAFDQSEQVLVLPDETASVAAAVMLVAGVKTVTLTDEMFKARIPLKVDRDIHKKTITISLVAPRDT